MRFSLNERVRVIATGQVGEVKTIKTELTMVNGQPRETYQYFIFIPPVSNRLFNENELTHEKDEPEFSKKFELKFIDFLIDVYLKHRKFDLVKKLSDEKKLY
ncbi:hypothetical protein [Bacillus xiapuensis]|uniref:Uncharacterized protein n=1 Tax=Bacillus xiapuensis TaxID=2014075 RepID=A0ABU6N866_9BACI|nr:hypothetical protein [Bacillus xiapuensis]